MRSRSTMRFSFKGALVVEHLLAVHTLTPVRTYLWQPTKKTLHSARCSFTRETFFLPGQALASSITRRAMGAGGAADTSLARPSRQQRIMKQQQNQRTVDGNIGTHPAANYTCAAAKCAQPSTHSPNTTSSQGPRAQCGVPARSSRQELAAVHLGVAPARHPVTRHTLRALRGARASGPPRHVSCAQRTGERHT